MTNTYQPTQAEVDALYERLKKDAEASGYYLNPDVEFAKELVRSLIINEKRYGYQACPCRLASGDRPSDTDIICPCDYRDADVAEHGACYCALYVSKDAAVGKTEIKSIPERRPSGGPKKAVASASGGAVPDKLAYPVWRCKVCGYLAARDGPPDTCPVCKARKDRFERFM